MPSERPAGFHVSLDLEPGADPIAGTFTHRDGTVARFRGWLELMFTLERMTSGNPARSSSSTPGGRTDADDQTQ
jgi:hypothetical protein